MSRSRAVSAVAVLLCLALPLTAAGPAASEVQTLDPQPSGMTVAIDRETGQLRAPTAKEAAVLMRELRTILDDSTDDLTTVTLENGAEMVDLQGRFLNVIIAVGQPEGDLYNECVEDLEQAQAVITSAVKSAPRGQE